MPTGPVCSPSPADLRAELVARVRELLEAPPYYVFGGATSPALGLDCSGLVVYLARELGLDLVARGIRSTDQMWTGLPAPAVPEPGDLALYGLGIVSDPASHVCVLLGRGVAGELEVAGMSGGGAWCASSAKAKAANPPAQLRRLSRHTYRSDFLGWRRLPLGG